MRVFNLGVRLRERELCRVGRVLMQAARKDVYLTPMKRFGELVDIPGAPFDARAHLRCPRLEQLRLDPAHRVVVNDRPGRMFNDADTQHAAPHAFERAALSRGTYVQDHVAIVAAAIRVIVT